MSLLDPRTWITACVVVLVVLAMPRVLAGDSASTAAAGPAAADIPPAALRDYQAAARVCPGLSWALLAGIGKVESDHGRSTLLGVHSGANFAGAMGPMQFLAPTWAAYHQPGMGDVYDHRDASFAAARLLCANGAASPAGVARAVHAYNHDWSYVDQVLRWASKYTAGASS